MPRIDSLASLQQANKTLGPIHFLNYTGMNLEAAHRALGETVQGQARRVLQRRLDKLSPSKLKEKLSLARQCGLALEERVQNKRIDQQVRNAVEEYLACLAAWMDGVCLADYQHPSLEQTKIEGLKATPRDLALFLQDDNVGCQTGALRLADSSVIFWHTEENLEKVPNEHFDQLRIATFRIASSGETVDSHSFIYPYLLPGSSFSWRSDGYFQATDSLYIKPVIQSNALFANIVCWVTLRIGKALPAQEVIAALFPFSDGYAHWSFARRNGLPAVNKVEFAGDQMISCELGKQPGDSLFQVNIVSQTDSLIAARFEHISLASRRRYIKRFMRSSSLIERIKTAQEPLKAVQEMLTSRYGGSYAYANADVKAYVVGRLTPSGLALWVGAGTALKGEYPMYIGELIA
jgi:hypothetical protein